MESSEKIKKKKNESIMHAEVSHLCHLYNKAVINLWLCILQMKGRK